MDHRKNSLIQPTSDDIVVTARLADAAFSSADFKLTQHPLGAVLPPLPDDDYAKLREDIGARGQLVPIERYDGQILTGWHRYNACRDLGIEPWVTDFTGTLAEAAAHVRSLDVLRRKLSPSQESIVVAKLIAIVEQGARLPLAVSAKQYHISERTLKDATQVIGSGNAELIARVDAGELSVSQAATRVREQKRQTAVVVPPGAVGARLRLDVAPCTLKQWKLLTPEAQRTRLDCRDPRATLNRQKPGEDDNLIDWASQSWNAIVGCEHGCSYCYARDISERFDPNGFAPTFHPERLSAPLNVAPPASDDPRDRCIFAGSMSDMFGRWVPREWIEAVLAIMRQAPAWTFIVLTKFPKRLAEFDIPENVWVGTSIDCQDRVKNAEDAFARINARTKFASVEPMLTRITFTRIELFHMVIVGAASKSSQTSRWIPPYEWREHLAQQADAASVALYEKSNLLRKEEPHGVRYQFTDKLPREFDHPGRKAED